MPTNTLTPNVFVSSGDIAVTGASLNAAWSDNSDATYATWTLPNGFGTVGFDTVTLPAGAVTSTITPTLRMSVATGSAYVSCAVYVVRAGSYVLIGSGFGYWSYSTGSMTYPAFQATLSQADLDSIVMGVSAQYDINVPPTFRAYQANLTLVYATAPTVTVTAPTGVQATSSVTVAWSAVAGTDGGPFTAIQVKVATAAQYASWSTDALITAGVADYDSGATGSALPSWTVSGLANSSTYRAYVREAQTVNGVLQWSAWAYSGFTTSFTTAIVASVTPTASNAGGYISVVVARSTSGPNTAWEYVDVERSDDAGVTWELLRGGDNVAATNNFVTVWGASSMTIRDYEAANGTSMMYRARAFRTVSSSEVAGAYVTSSAASWSSTDTWFKDPLTPSRNTGALRAVSMSGLARGRTQGVFQIVNRADPVVISDVLSTRSGTVVVRTTSDADAVLLQALLDNATVWLIQQPATDQWGSKYVAVGSVTEVRLNEQKMGDPWRFWQVQYVEVAPPADQT